MADKLLTRRCCTCCMSSFGDFEDPVLILRVIVDVPQRAPPITGKHQECGRNDQKGSTGRRHNKGEFHPSRDGLHHSLNSTIEQIGSGALIFFLCWMVNVNQSDIFQNKRIPLGGGGDSIFYDAGPTTGTNLQTFSK
ncbi:uncharacterized protein LOC144200253 isoform X2 [Stigmatopora nigra]